MMWRYFKADELVHRLNCKSIHHVPYLVNNTERYSEAWIIILMSILTVTCMIYGQTARWSKIATSLTQLAAGQAAATSNGRSCKRQPSSTIWSQRLYLVRIDQASEILNSYVIHLTQSSKRQFNFAYSKLL